MHETFMKVALELAIKGAGRVHPNPMVGAVLVRDDEVIGCGYHDLCGGSHAEVEAINNAFFQGYTDFSGTTLYVTLEPCCHFGRTPPCTSLIIETGIKKVVTGMKDPNPLVAGKGIEALRNAGIDVVEGILEKDCRELNRIFIKYITTGKPFVLLKSAFSLDGKTATANGDSRWISCEQSREDVHRLRGEYTAVMCGIGTVLADNPLLTVRGITGHDPVRIIADGHLRIPLDSRIVKTAHKIRTLIATTETGETDKAKKLKEAGAILVCTGEHEGHIDLAELMVKLGEMEIDSILLEGGGTLAFSALKAGVVDRVRFYVAPLLIGGASSSTAVAGNGFPTLAGACTIENLSTGVSGTDILVEGNVCLPE